MLKGLCRLLYIVSFPHTPSSLYTHPFYPYPPQAGALPLRHPHHPERRTARHLGRGQRLLSVRLHIRVEDGRLEGRAGLRGGARRRRSVAQVAWELVLFLSLLLFEYIRLFGRLMGGAGRRVDVAQVAWELVLFLMRPMLLSFLSRRDFWLCFRGYWCSAAEQIVVD